MDPDARGIARLDSSLEWEAVPDAPALGEGPVLTWDGNRGLIATGWFDTSGEAQVEKLAYFDGTTRYPLGPGLHNDGVGDTGRALFDDNGTVYVGGLFDQAGNVWSENISAFTLKTEIILESDFEID